ncbi:MAG: DUF3226 domain-containing protein [Verrucomicrobiota bacterium]
MAGSKSLLVEGVDDKHVILALQGTFSPRVLDKTQIHDLEGYPNLLRRLPREIQASEGGAVGAVLDADINLAHRWSGIRQMLEGKGYRNVPHAPTPAGTIVTPPLDTLLPKVGIWLMPDNSTSGILEDFLKFLVPEGDTLLAFASETINQLPEKSSADKFFADKDRPKALMHTWLAWQAKPGTPFGQAITASFLDANAAQADVFVKWLQELFAD